MNLLLIIPSVFLTELTESWCSPEVFVATHGYFYTLIPGRPDEPAGTVFSAVPPLRVPCVRSVHTPSCTPVYFGVHGSVSNRDQKPCLIDVKSLHLRVQSCPVLCCKNGCCNCSLVVAAFLFCRVQLNMNVRPAILILLYNSAERHSH